MFIFLNPVVRDLFPIAEDREHESCMITVNSGSEQNFCAAKAKQLWAFPQMNISLSEAPGGNMDSIFFLKTWINHHCPHLFCSVRCCNYSGVFAKVGRTSLAVYLTSTSKWVGVILNMAFYCKRSYLWLQMTYR